MGREYRRPRAPAAKQGGLRMLTKLIAGVWIAVYAWSAVQSVIQCFRPSPLAERFSNPTAVLLIPVLISVPLASAAVALLARRTWGWWVLVIWSGAMLLISPLTISILDQALAMQRAGHATPGNPGVLLRWLWPMLAFYVLTLVGLLTDSPSRWRRAESAPPESVPPGGQP